MNKKKTKVAFVKTETKPKNIAKTNLIDSITTLHGTNLLSTKTGTTRLLWSLLLIANVIWTIAFIIIIKDRYHNDQIVTKIYSDWSVEKVPFPAINICNFNMVSLNESKNIVKILSKYNITKQETDSFFHDLFYLKDFGVGSADVSNHSEIMTILKSHYFNMEIIMEELHQKCSNLLVYCEFDGKERKCDEIFNKIQTSEGHCCTFNYNGVEDFDPTVVHYDDFEYYYDESPEGDVTRTRMIASSQSGRLSGLRVVIDVQPEDYADWAPVYSYGAKILLNDPNDYPETRLVYTYLEIGESLDMKVEPKIFRCEPSVRSIEPAKRGCWFHDEVNLLNTNRYSYETCSTECRIKSYLSFCGCVPYKYPVEPFTRICELVDLPCLNFMKAHWSTTKSNCVPECYKECSDKEYSILTDSTPFLSQYFPERVTKDRNVSELAALSVYYMKSTCNCYMMSLLIDFNYFIATYGGIFSLSFGASIITILELIYLALSSLIKVFWKSDSLRIKT